VSWRNFASRSATFTPEAGCSKNKIKAVVKVPLL